MLQYIYKAQEIGLTEWPSGTLRLEGIPVTEDPEEADIFVCPGPLLLFQNPSDLDRFPYIKERESSHVYFDCSDYEPLYGKKCLFIRCNTRTWYLDKDPNTISWAWPVENYAGCMDVPEGGFKYDISFQGWNWSDVRMKSIESCKNLAGLNWDIAAYTDFFGYLKEDNPEFHRRRGEFRRSMRESRIALCPESIPGVFPYRFFEAMSAGRIPLLVGSDFVFPFADVIPYQDFIIHLERSHADQAGFAALDFIQSHSDDDIIERGKLGRGYWQQYLNRDDWSRTAAAAVRKKLCASP